MKPRAIDLYCGAGGATKGLQLAGFHVTGVDINQQPNYIGDAFIQADALTVPLDGYDFIWASPPCQRYSMYSVNLGTSERHPDLVGPTRRRLVAAGAIYAIENVVGAPLYTSVILCGSMFGLPVRRHRVIETSWALPALQLSCNHEKMAIFVYGNGTPQWHRKKLGRNVGVAEQRIAMGIDWMPRKQLSQAVPPAYGEFIGRHAIAQLRRAA